MKSFIATLPLCPMPYVRMTQRSKWTDRAQAYLASQQQIGMLIRAQSKGKMFPPRTPLRLSIMFFCRRGTMHNRDLNNLVKALEDACNGVIWDDDRWIDQYGEIARIPWNHDETRLKVEVL